MHASRLGSRSHCNSRTSLCKLASFAQLDANSFKCSLQLIFRHHRAFQDFTHLYRFENENGSRQHIQQLGRRKIKTSCATVAAVSSSASSPDSSSGVPPAGPSPSVPVLPSSFASSFPPSSSGATAITVNAIFASSSGIRCWRVRPYDNSDYAAIIEVQTDSFHTSNPVPFLNAFTYNNFRAEVVDALRQKIKYADPAIFQLLVAEELAEPLAEPAAATTSSNSNNDDTSNSNQGHPAALVGSVEVSLMQDWEVIRVLPRASQPATASSTGGGRRPHRNSGEYAYISSMCVRTGSRRRGVAQALMAAAEAQARLWRQPRLALHVHKDNAAAVALYLRCGMRVVGEDPGWRTMLGGKVRLLMYKELAMEGAEGEGEAEMDREEEGEI